MEYELFEILDKYKDQEKKEYVFIGNAQNKTRDYIKQLEKDNRELLKYKNAFEELEQVLDITNWDKIKKSCHKGIVSMKIDYIKQKYNLDKE